MASSMPLLIRWRPVPLYENRHRKLDQPEEPLRRRECYIPLMSDTERYTETEWHTRCAKGFFNFTWTLLDKPSRTVEDDDTMLHAAHASTFHWEKVGHPLNFERGHWIISRVNSVLRRPEAALYHAKRCLEICLAHDIGDFDLAFAYEALARAHSVAGDLDDARRFHKLATEAGKRIAEDDDRRHFEKEVESIRL